MRERVARHMGQVVEGMPWLGTFHSIGAKMLRRHAELVGLKSNFTILDTDDQLRLLERPGPPSRSPKHHALGPRVGKAKNAGPKLWITGISGTTSGTFSDWLNRPGLGCCSVLLRLPRSCA